VAILVTGSTGAIGSAFVERVAARRRLRLLVRPDEGRTATERVAEAIGKAFDQGRIEVWTGDLARPHLGLGARARRRLISGISGIVHLAARTDFCGSGIDAYRAVNVEGTRRVAALAAACGCPMLFVSTAYVCGAREGVFFERETGAGERPNNAYERSKQEAEMVARELARKCGFPLTIVRPGIVLPLAPRGDTAPGPGPLVHLQLLARLEGSPETTPRVVRYAARPDGLLNLVPEGFVVRILEAALERAGSGAIKTYHAVAARTFRLDEVLAAMDDCLEGLSVRLVPPGETAGFDRYERLFDRRCRIYRPYLDLHSRFDRREMLADLGDGDDGADIPWLRGVFENHVHAWRAAGIRRGRASPGTLDRVRNYFLGFLAGKCGRLLLPDLHTLQADFTISVPGAGSHRVRIEDGRLTVVAPAGTPSPAFDYEVEANDFLAIAAARTRPAELFFDRRVHVRGDLFRAISTATALEEFFRLFPYGAGPAFEARA